MTDAAARGTTVDDEINACLADSIRKSFFLYAGAGTGKTRALVTALDRFRVLDRNRMRFRGQQVGVITYTNAACDEIKHRLQFDALFSISTIHSFVWDLIGGFNSDIRAWLRTTLPLDIAELQEQLRTGRPGTKTATKRERSLRAKQQRLATLDGIRRFIYSPTGDNRTRDSLSHSEVIKLAAAFLTAKPLMHRLLISRFPLLFIDESQDTNKLLMEALLNVQSVHKDRFALGLFGDTMQRIYSDGKVDLGHNLPSDWAKPSLTVNHRCPKRIVQLINKIRFVVDAHQQVEKPGAHEGQARLFIAPSSTADKYATEERVRQKMVELTGDSKWGNPDQVKILTLEHHMAATRMRFVDVFQPLYQIDGYKTGLLDGSLPIIRFFTGLILPLIRAQQAGNDFAVAAILRKDSPLLSVVALQSAGSDQRTQLRTAKAAMDALMMLWSDNAKPTCLDVLRTVAISQLFEIPDLLRPFAEAQPDRDDPALKSESHEPDQDDDSDSIVAIGKFLSAPFHQIEPYAAYVAGEAAFDTHQGVKGLQFPRVLVVMDDEEAQGFLFSYDKLFGAKPKTRADLANEREGSETAIERTRRLFYVTCSRTQESLALVAYSSNPANVRQHAINQGWFVQNEIETLI